MEIGQVLKDTENSLRDFIALILSEKLGSDWVDKCGVPSERILKWRERKQIEVKRQEAGAVDERLIYYADFYDLKTIFKEHWQYFAQALGDLKTMVVWLSEFEKLRDPDAHGRELLPHQKNLLLGISGELRTKIARYRSQ
jgi:Swt1-like HEPN